jgi:hypothetical protein
LVARRARWQGLSHRPLRFFAPLVALLFTSTAGRATAWRVLLGLGALPLLIAV